jgi:hypothetical protein
MCKCFLALFYSDGKIIIMADGKRPSGRWVAGAKLDGRSCAGTGCCALLKVGPGFNELSLGMWQRFLEAW